jgi:hypothetical protein
VTYRKRYTSSRATTLTFKKVTPYHKFSRAKFIGR